MAENRGAAAEDTDSAPPVPSWRVERPFEGAPRPVRRRAATSRPESPPVPSAVPAPAENIELLLVEPAAVAPARVVPTESAARGPRIVRPAFIALLCVTACAAAAFLTVSLRANAVRPRSSPPPPIARGMIRTATAPAEPAPAPLEVRSLVATDLPSLLHEALQTAVDFAEKGEIEQASLAYRDVLMMGRDDPKALSGLMHLRRRYQEALQTEIRFAPIRNAFESEDFRDALALLYRLPSDAAPARVRRASANGWYDLAVVALRAGRCDEAARDLGEAFALDLRPGGTGGAATLAARCDRMSSDRSFRAAAEALRFRDMDE